MMPSSWMSTFGRGRAFPQRPTNLARGVPWSKFISSQDGNSLLSFLCIVRSHRPAKALPGASVPAANEDGQGADNKAATHESLCMSSENFHELPEQHLDTLFMITTSSPRSNARV